MTDVCLVTDGWTDIYGVFGSRELAQTWIDRQKALGYPWADHLKIHQWTLNVAQDLPIPQRQL